MSYELAGVLYHSVEAYRKARREMEIRKAIREAENLRRAVSGLEKEIAADREQLNRVQGQLERQKEINQRIEANVGAIKRNQQMLEQRMHENEAQMKEGFDEVRQTFAEVRQDMQRGLAEAEKRRAESVALLQGEIAKVRAEAERREAERVQKQRDRLQQAQEQFKIAEEILVAQESYLHDLDLHDAGTVLRQTIAHGRRLLAGQDASAAQALAATALSDARGLEQNVANRHTSLDSARAEATSRARALLSRLSEEDSQETAEYFPAELAQAKAKLQSLLAAASRGFQHHQALRSERAAMEAELNSLDEITLDMLSSAPSVKLMADRRIEQARILLEKLEMEYGPRTKLRQEFETPDDPKSPLVLNCEFGGSRVRVSIDLRRLFHRWVRTRLCRGLRAFRSFPGAVVEW